MRYTMKCLGGGKLKPVIKWPGGKTREIDKIRHLLPDYERYIEPFFGGGAVFFDLMPEKGAINDISNSLMLFYKLIKHQDTNLKEHLVMYDKSFQSLILSAEQSYQYILDSYHKEDLHTTKDVVELVLSNANLSHDLVLDYSKYKKIIFKNVQDKFNRTHINNEKKEFSHEDLKENLITGFTSGFYMYFRDIYNDINLKKIKVEDSYNIANFYFIREYCYGSMFRYNNKGEFNIPYGGMTYNRKQFSKKIDAIFNEEIENLFKDIEIYNLDFEDFLNEVKLTSNDFVFLDPPYDTDFSDYEGRSFDADDQKRLCNYLKNIPSKFILIIKDTDLIYKLYKDDFNIVSFDKNYTYNVRSRNERNVTHLIITNY